MTADQHKNSMTEFCRMRGLTQLLFAAYDFHGGNVQALC